MIIAGPVMGFASKLGLVQGDDSILDAVDVIGAPFIPESFDDGETFWSFNGAGVEFQFTSDELTAIFFHLEPEQDDPELGVWRQPLIDGLTLPATAEETIDRLGKPEETGDGNTGPWYRYAAAWGFLHFDFDADRTRLVTLMRHRP